ncbi:hypothetical protein [Micromonospora sp. NPDC006431]|uniref:hypothetical protein n=1 Tax=Micromonospora sp. NPDC006431 TaxID=3364235 RepID=UPI00368CF285
MEVGLPIGPNVHVLVGVVWPYRRPHGDLLAGAAEEAVPAGCNRLWRPGCRPLARPVMSGPVPEQLPYRLAVCDGVSFLGKDQHRVRERAGPRLVGRPRAWPVTGGALCDRESASPRPDLLAYHGQPEPFGILRQISTDRLEREIGINSGLAPPIAESLTELFGATVEKCFPDAQSKVQLVRSHCCRVR